MNARLQELVTEYNVTVGPYGRIETPGRFEGEAPDVLYWEDAYMNGDPGAEYETYDDGWGWALYVADLWDRDVLGLEPDVSYALLERTSHGFVYLSYLTAEETDVFLADVPRMEERR